MAAATSIGHAPLFEPAELVNAPVSKEELLTEDAWCRVVAVLRVLWTGRRLLARTTVAGIIVSTMVAFLLPKLYESTSQLVPPEEHSLAAAGGLGAVAGGAVEAELGLKSNVAMFARMLRSRTVTDRLVTRFDLKKRYAAALAEGARQELADRTTINEDLRSGVISVTVRDSSAEMAAGLAQAYAEELNHRVAELSASAAHRERTFVERRLKSLQEEMHAAARDFSEFASTNTAIDLQEQGKAMLGAAAIVQQQLILADSEMKSLEQVYTANNVRVRAARARARELERQLASLSGGQTLASDTLAVNSGSNSSTKSGDRAPVSPYPRIRELPVLGIRYNELLRRNKDLEAIHQLLVRQYEMARVQEAREVPTVRVLDAAVVPEVKCWPPRRAIMLLGTAFAFVLASGWLLADSWWHGAGEQHPLKPLAVEVMGQLKIYRPPVLLMRAMHQVDELPFWQAVRARLGERNANNTHQR